jgi:hypothetical protein
MEREVDDTVPQCGMRRMRVFNPMVVAAVRAFLDRERAH